MNNIVVYNKKEINDRLSCSICLEYYKEPRNLLCGHSFCTECLDVIKISNNVIICPLCRFKTQLFNLSITDLPINSSLVSIIDIKDNTLNKKLDEKPKLKKSKSADCLCINKSNNQNKNKIYFTKPTFDDYDSDDEYIHNENCCYQ